MNCAVRLWLPNAGAFHVVDAVLPLTGDVPISVVPSKNETVPPGLAVGPVGVIVAVRVVFAPAVAVPVVFCGLGGLAAIAVAVVV
jgi:hypothetical protein